MEYRSLGKTGLTISRLGFGGIPIQKIDADGTRELIFELMLSVALVASARGDCTVVLRADDRLGRVICMEGFERFIVVIVDGVIDARDVHLKSRALHSTVDRARDES